MHKNYKIKIGDFGISKKLNPKSFAKSEVGTYKYMAPEVSSNQIYDKYVDIW